jgi:hypothetical protein
MRVLSIRARVLVCGERHFCRVIDKEMGAALERDKVLFLLWFQFFTIRDSRRVWFSWFSMFVAFLDGQDPNRTFGPPVMAPCDQYSSL